MPAAPDYRESEREGITAGQRGPQSKKEAEAAEESRRETMSEVELDEAEARDRVAAEDAHSSPPSVPDEVFTAGNPPNLGSRQDDANQDFKEKV